MVPAVMADQLMVDFDIGAAALGNFSSFYYYSYVAVQIPTGILADYWGPRKLLTAGTLLASLGAFLFAFSPSILLANIGRLLIGGSIGVAWVSVLKLSTRWFTPGRFAISTGLALSLGIGGALSAGVPLRLLMDLFGWRPVIFGAGVITLVLAISIWAFVRDDPVQKGYSGLSSSSVDSNRKSRSFLLGDLAKVFRFKNTWLLTIVPSGLAGPLLSFAGLWGVPYFTTHYHLTPVKSAAIISTLLIAWALGGPILGALSERMGRSKPLYFGALCIALIGWVLILFTQSYSLWFIVILLGLVGFASGAIIIGFAFVKEIWAMYLFAAVFGIGAGGTAPVESTITAELFGMKSHGSIFGIISAGFTIGAAIGPFVTGFLFDVTGNYQMAFLVCSGIGVIGLIFSLLVKPIVKPDN